jgi:UDP:flavonoid glycosyltransferase YjiC (YdhE family)
LTFNFLLASWGSAGDHGPMLTAARQLRRAGHGVRIIARSDMREEFEAAGFGFAAWSRISSPSDSGSAANAPDPSDLPSIIGRICFTPAAAYAADTRDEFDSGPTDAVLGTSALIGSALAAEAAGIPYAMLSPHISLRPLPGAPSCGSGLMPPRTPEERAEVEAVSNRFAAGMNAWLPVLNEARGSQGLAPLDHVFDLYDRAERVLLAISAAFDFPADYLPANVRYVGPLLDPPGWSKPWTAPWLPQSDRARALVSFSTSFQDQTETLQRVINVLGAMAIDAVVTTGPALVDATLQAAKNVTLLHSAPHDAVMKEVSLVVTHGGHGTVSRALVHGLPLLVMPMGRDQNDNALRVEAKGAGLTLPPTAAEAEIAAALNRLITEPQFRVAASRLGKAIAADIDSTSLVSEMEAIAAIGAGANRLAGNAS